MMSSDDSQAVFAQSMKQLHMAVQPEAAIFGTLRRGDGLHSKGWYWSFGYSGLFYISNCEFQTLRDVRMVMPAMQYIDLRWKRDGIFSGGRLTSFIEEGGQEGYAILPAGVRVSYLEVLYMPLFYEQYLPGLFSGQPNVTSPAEILKSLNTSGNWPPEILRLFLEMD
ncbi:MAG: hypothetical protein ACRDBM_15450, partial [Sporomusa sp.]